MALKTFNVDGMAYKKYSTHCKKNGISMSKQIERFISEEVARIETQTPKNIAAVDVRTVESSLARDVHPSTRNSTDHAMRKFC